MSTQPLIGEQARKPEWLKVRLPGGSHFVDVKGLVKDNKLHTVCESARCPNLGECWNRKTATFMILGDVCTRSCRFCAVKTGRPLAIDADEPARVAEAVGALGLKYAVITSVNRDELADGGATHFARTIGAIRKIRPECTIEVLIPDFRGSEAALQIVLDAEPDVLNHNIETVPHLYKLVRPQAHYMRSLQLLQRAAAQGARTKSGIMVGLGETFDQVVHVMRDLIAHDCRMLTIGQYLQPSKQHLPVARYVTPKEFGDYKRLGPELGFSHIESGPLVRSSYHADEQFSAAK